MVVFVKIHVYNVKIILLFQHSPTNPSHWPSALQCKCSWPDSVKPASHDTVTFVAKAVTLADKEPLEGGFNNLQSANIKT